MKKTIHLLSISLFVFFAACSGGEQQVVQEADELVKTVNVKTQAIQPSDFNSYVRVVGTIETSDDILISAEVNGKVLRYSVQEGDKVREGQEILKIDDRKLKQEKARLEAQTALARENYERLQKVYEDGVGSELDFLNAKYNYEQSASALESIKVDLENTSITAPFDGRVESINFEVGEMVMPGAGVVRLIGTNNYKVTAGIPARYADAVSHNEVVEVWMDTQNADTMELPVTFVGNSINPQNRTFKVEIDLPKRGDLKVDMIANIRLNTLSKENVIVLSEEFIYSKDGRYVVYVTDTNDEGKMVAREKVVQLGNSYKSNVIVENGLEAGEKLITIGSAFLNDGMRINEVESESNTALAAQ